MRRSILRERCEGLKESRSDGYK